MPFETSYSLPRRIAVIGGGISGLGAAHLLSRDHRVTLYEAAPRLGGHARTVHAGRRGDRAVDTGFIVFNRATYPRLTALFDELEVPVAPSDMGFAASLRGGRLEYALRDLAALTCRGANLRHPGFLRMLRDILRFNARAEAAADSPDMTIGDLLERLRTGPWFRDAYLLPFSGAIWSTPSLGILDFPAQPLVRFFRNHGLLGVTGQHAWFTVRGGSIEYVRRLAASLDSRGVELRTGAPIAGVRRRSGGAEVRAVGGEWEGYDDVVLATHADVSLRLLSDASAKERASLGAVRYHPNEAVLHADPAAMPQRRRLWSSWNYAEADGDSARVGVTYWMNSLQPIPREDPLFVTLNPARPIDPALVYDTTTFRHPLYDRAAFAAQAAVQRWNGQRRTWFCGAWLRHGFHEDGLASAAMVADAIAAESAREFAAA